MKIELRNDSVVLTGYINTVERESRPMRSSLGEFVEVVRAGAFKRSLHRQPNVDLLLNHREDRKLGSTTEGNLELFEDNIGLRAICTVTDPEVIAKAKADKLRGWSFGFYCNKDNVDSFQSPNRRYVEDLDLFEVSIIDDTKLPAYVGTSIEMREGKECLKELRTFKFEPVQDNDYLRYKNTLEGLRD